MAQDDKDQNQSVKAVASQSAGVPERPNAFSKGYTHRHGKPVSDACGDDQHEKCDQDLTKCHCTYRGFHTTMHAYANFHTPHVESAEVPAPTEKELLEFIAQFDCPCCGFPNCGHEHSVSDIFRKTITKLRAEAASQPTGELCKHGIMFFNCDECEAASQPAPAANVCKKCGCTRISNPPYCPTGCDEVAEAHPARDQRWLKLFDELHGLWGRWVENEAYCQPIKDQFGRLLRFAQELETAMARAESAPQLDRKSWEAGRDAGAHAIERNTCVRHCELCRTYPCGVEAAKQIRALEFPAAELDRKNE